MPHAPIAVVFAVIASLQGMRAALVTLVAARLARTAAGKRRRVYRKSVPSGDVIDATRTVLVDTAVIAVVLRAGFGHVTTSGPWLGAVAFVALFVWFEVSRGGHVFIAVSFHAMHHARRCGHYGLFTRVLDRALGTEHADYDAVQTRAATGRGLPRLGERLTSPPTAHAPRHRCEGDKAP